MNKNATFSCDFCSKQTPVSERVYMCQPRPSDPSEIVAVLWTCPTCVTPTPGTMVGTRAMLDKYIESAAAKEQGYVFLSL